MVRLHPGASRSSIVRRSNVEIFLANASNVAASSSFCAGIKSFRRAHLDVGKDFMWRNRGL